MSKRLLCLATALCLLLTLALPARAAAYSDLPAAGSWSYEALNAAIANGLLQGSDGTLRPEAPLTRAEMAAILVRALGATEAAATQFSDVGADDWFADEVAIAVQMGAFQGADGNMRPNDYISRQEAFVALSRVLLTEDGNAAVLQRFADADQVADWAVSGVAALVSGGYISGSNGRLNPTANITRAEFAKVLHTIGGTYCSAAGTYTDARGSVIIRTPDVTLKDMVIDGDLIIADGVGNGDVTLDNVTISGRLIVRGGGENSILIINNSNMAEVVVGKFVEGPVRIVSDNAQVQTVYLQDGKDDVILVGNFSAVTVASSETPVILREAIVKALTVTVPQATVKMDGPTTVAQVEIPAEAAGTAVEVAATAKIETVTTKAESVTLSGAGKVESLTIAAPAAEVKLEGKTTVKTVTIPADAPGAAVEVTAGAKVTTVTSQAENVTLSGAGKVENVSISGNNTAVDVNAGSVIVDKNTTGVTQDGSKIDAGTTTTPAPQPSIPVPTPTPVPTPDPTPVPPPDPSPAPATVTTENELAAALRNANVTEITVSGTIIYASINTIVIDKPLTIATGSKLTFKDANVINNSTITVQDHASFFIESNREISEDPHFTFVNNGTLINNYEVNLQALTTNNGTMQNNCMATERQDYNVAMIFLGSLANNSRIENNGSLSVGFGSSQGGMAVGTGTPLTNAKGAVIVNNAEFMKHWGGDFVNDGSIENNRNFQVHGANTVNNGNITCRDTISSSGNLLAFWAVGEHEEGYQQNPETKVTNNGTIDMEYCSLDVFYGAEFVNEGTLNIPYGDVHIGTGYLQEDYTGGPLVQRAEGGAARPSKFVNNGSFLLGDKAAAHGRPQAKFYLRSGSIEVGPNAETVLGSTASVRYFYGTTLPTGQWYSVTDGCTDGSHLVDVNDLGGTVVFDRDELAYAMVHANTLKIVILDHVGNWKDATHEEITITKPVTVLSYGELQFWEYKVTNQSTITVQPNGNLVVIGDNSTTMNAAAGVIDNKGLAYLCGTVENNGTLRNSETMRVCGTLTNKSQIKNSDTLYVQPMSPQQPSSLINETSATISGGYIQFMAGALRNEGTMDIGGLDASSEFGQGNHGTTEVTNLGTLTISKDATDTTWWAGQLRAEGDVTVHNAKNAALTINNGRAVFNGGTLLNEGTINTAVSTDADDPQMQLMFRDGADVTNAAGAAMNLSHTWMDFTDSSMTNNGSIDGNGAQILFCAQDGAAQLINNSSIDITASVEEVDDKKHIAGGLNIDEGASMTNNAGAVIDITGGWLNIRDAETSATNDGTITITGAEFTATVDGTQRTWVNGNLSVSVNAALENNGIILGNGAWFDVYENGTLVNNGTMSLSGKAFDNTAHGRFMVTDGAAVENHGALTITGLPTSTQLVGTLELWRDAALTNHPNGTITLEDGAQFNNRENSTVTNNGDISLQSSSLLSLNTNATLTNNGTLDLTLGDLCIGNSQWNGSAVIPEAESASTFVNNGKVTVGTGTTHENGSISRIDLHSGSIQSGAAGLITLYGNGFLFYVNMETIPTTTTWCVTKCDNGDSHINPIAGYTHWLLTDASCVENEDGTYSQTVDAIYRSSYNDGIFGYNAIDPTHSFIADGNAPFGLLIGAVPGAVTNFAAGAVDRGSITLAPVSETEHAIVELRSDLNANIYSTTDDFGKYGDYNINNGGANAEIVYTTVATDYYYVVSGIDRQGESYVKSVEHYKGYANTPDFVFDNCSAAYAAVTLDQGPTGEPYYLANAVVFETYETTVEVESPYFAYEQLRVSADLLGGDYVVITPNGEDSEYYASFVNGVGTEAYENLGFFSYNVITAEATKITQNWADYGISAHTIKIAQIGSAKYYVLDDVGGMQIKVADTTPVYMVLDGPAPDYSGVEHWKVSNYDNDLAVDDKIILVTNNQRAIKYILLVESLIPDSIPSGSTWSEAAVELWNTIKNPTASGTEPLIHNFIDAVEAMTIAQMDRAIPEATLSALFDAELNAYMELKNETTALDQIEPASELATAYEAFVEDLGTNGIEAWEAFCEVNSAAHDSVKLLLDSYVDGTLHDAYNALSATQQSFLQIGANEGLISAYVEIPNVDIATVDDLINAVSEYNKAIKEGHANIDMFVNAVLDAYNAFKTMCAQKGYSYETAGQIAAAVVTAESLSPSTTDATAAFLADLADPAVATITLKGFVRLDASRISAPLTINKPVVIPYGLTMELYDYDVTNTATITLDGGSLKLFAGNDLFNQGTITVSGDQGYLGIEGGTLYNEETINLDAGMISITSSKLSNSGTVNVNGHRNTTQFYGNIIVWGSITNHSGGSINLNGGLIRLCDGADFENSATLNISGTRDTNGDPHAVFAMDDGSEIRNNSNGEIKITEGYLEATGSNTYIYNGYNGSGTITLNGSAGVYLMLLDNGATLNNSNASLNILNGALVLGSANSQAHLINGNGSCNVGTASGTVTKTAQLLLKGGSISTDVPFSVFNDGEISCEPGTTVPTTTWYNQIVSST